jgi:NAD(P)-dependent dehydrogenase (short-subunit alcohol dehydrogenase family)
VSGVLADRVVVVTGASEGLGVAIAQAVSQVGGRLVLAARRGLPALEGQQPPDPGR